MDKSAVVLDVNAGSPAEETEAVELKAAEGDPFRILILGDFSGAAARSAVPSRKPARIDRDNFDDVLRRFHVGVEELNLTFQELEDFEPDAIFRRCEGFHSDAPFEAETRAAAPEPPPSSVESDVQRLMSGSLLDDILEQAETPAEARRRPRDEMQALVERVVSPYRLPRESRQEISARERKERANQALMRAILRHPKLQSLEAAWRGLGLMVGALDFEDGLSISILDLSKAEAAADLAGGRGLLYRVLVEETVGTPGGQPWALILGNYEFSRSREDVAMLERLAALARGCGAPFLAEAEPPGDSGGEEWAKLRAHPAAAWAGLALPRFLGRLPYGRNTYQVESFPFEEVEGAPKHSDFLWVNPAFACGLLLGESYNRRGWRFRPGADREISGLPYFTFEQDGETCAQPCGELLLTDSEIELLHEEGLMALAPVKNRDAVVLIRFQSIAEPLCGLAGRWA